MTAFVHERFHMVERQLRDQGIRDEQVLAAMGRIPRHLFLAPESWGEAYAPRAVPIEAGQTISQPYMVALMTQALHLTGEESVLEIGTGSGYQAAVLAKMARHVFSVDRIEQLVRGAAAVFEELKIDNVSLSVGDGSQGWSEHAPYDRILVTAAAPSIPGSLMAQLGDPGRLVAPVGNQQLQHLVIVDRRDGVDRVEEGTACRFVPLLGQEGFAADAS